MGPPSWDPALESATVARADVPTEGFPPPPSAPVEPGRSRKPLIVVAVVVVVAVVGLVGVRLLGGGGATPSVTADGYRLTEVPGSQPEQRWEARLDGQIHSVTATNDRVYVISSLDDYDRDRFGTDRTLTVFDHGGREVHVEDRLDSETMAFSAGGLVYVGGYEKGDIRDRDGKASLWRVSDFGFLAADMDGDILNEIYRRGTEVTERLAAKDGRVLWSERGGFGDRCGNRIILEDDGDVRVIDAASGRELWSERGYMGRCGDGIVVVNDDDRVTAFDLGSGDRRWEKRGDYIDAVSDGVVVVYESGSRTTGFAAKSGDELWSIRGSVEDVAHGAMSVWDDDRYSIHRVRDGEELERLSRVDGVMPVDRGWLTFEGDGSSTDRVSLLDPEGRERWVFSTRDLQGIEGGLLFEVDGDRLTVHG